MENTNEINFADAWKELDERDVEILTHVLERVSSDEGDTTLTLEQLKDVLALAYMTGVVIAEQDMMSALISSMMPPMDLGGDGEGGKTSEDEENVH